MLKRQTLMARQKQGGRKSVQYVVKIALLPSRYENKQVIQIEQGKLKPEQIHWLQRKH